MKETKTVQKISEPLFNKMHSSFFDCSIDDNFGTEDAIDRANM
jgi:hypothetical protein